MSTKMWKKSHIDIGSNFYKSNREKPQKDPKVGILSIRGKIIHQPVTGHK